MTEEVENFGENEKLVVIPWNHVELDVTPICISTVDDSGRPVHRGWIDAVKPIAEPLRAMARRVLGDEWRVSELAEGSVHALSAKHGPELGRSPSSRIYVHAKWRAKDLAAGGRRARVFRDVELRDHVLAALKEPYDFAHAFEDQEFLERIQEQLEKLDLPDVLTMMELYLTDSQDQIAEVFGVSRTGQARNTLCQRFHRALRKARKLLKPKSRGHDDMPMAS